MTTVRFFSEKIVPWYRKHKRVFPWRKKGISAYEVWVSEIMLQQTQAARVIPFYEKFLKRFPNIESLSRAKWRQFLPYWEGLGYYARGRNMLKTAKLIVKKHEGRFPKERTLLETLPGIGEYTASAILSFAFGKREVAFDTNMKKVFGTRGTARKAFEKSGVPSAEFNSAVMDYGSTNKREKTRARRRQTRGKTLPTMARVVVVLHENHKKYFSSRKRGYAPFEMPKGVSSRTEIKRFFQEKYGLLVSVRPAVLKEGALVLNVQILSGNKKQFISYPLRAVEERQKFRGS